jgi:hypothetical protein
MQKCLKSVIIKLPTQEKPGYIEVKLSLTEKLEKVIDRETYLEFVKALIDDWEKDIARIND